MNLNPARPIIFLAWISEITNRAEPVNAVTRNPQIARINPGPEIRDTRPRRVAQLYAAIFHSPRRSETKTARPRIQFISTAEIAKVAKNQNHERRDPPKNLTADGADDADLFFGVGRPSSAGVLLRRVEAYPRAAPDPKTETPAPSVRRFAMAPWPAPPGSPDDCPLRKGLHRHWPGPRTGTRTPRRQSRHRG